MTAAVGAGSLAPAAERRGLVNLAANRFLLNFSFFMLFPLISVHFTRDVGLSATVVGLVLAIRQISQQGPMILGATIAERLGYRPAITIGLFIRGLGLTGIAFADDLPLLIAGAVVFGLGGALGEATAAAALAAISPPATRPRRFSILAAIGGVGAATGPLIGVWLLEADFRWVGLGAAGACYLGGCLSYWLLPPIAGTPAQPLGFIATLQTVSTDRPFLVFAGLMIGYWFLFSQLFITVPLEVRRVSGGTEAIGPIYAVNSAILILLSYPVIRLVSRYLHPFSILQIGVALMGAGLSVFVLARDVGGLIAGVVVYALGQVLADPARETVTAQAARETARAAYFGLGLLALGIGGSIGQFTGGALFDLGGRIGLPALPWIVCLAIGLTVAGALGAFRLTRAGRRFADPTDDRP